MEEKLFTSKHGWSTPIRIDLIILMELIVTTNLIRRNKLVKEKHKKMFKQLNWIYSTGAEEKKLWQEILKITHYAWIWFNYF